MNTRRLLSPQFLGCAVTALALVFGGASPILATTLRHGDLRQLAAMSSDVIVGNVESVRSRWNHDRSMIVTEVLVTVRDRLKGARAERTWVRVIGGVADGVRMTVDGAPAFRPGEETVLFLRRRPGGAATVCGLAQGKFDVHVDPVTGRAYVQRGAPELRFSDVRSLKRDETPLASRGVPLEEFLREVSAAVRASNGGGR